MELESIRNPGRQQCSPTVELHNPSGLEQFVSVDGMSTIGTSAWPRRKISRHGHVERAPGEAVPRIERGTSIWLRS